MSRTATLLTLILLAACAALFALAPELDLDIARIFFRENGFAGTGANARLLRLLLFYLPAAVLVVLAAAWVAVRAGLSLPAWARPRGRSLAFLALSLALGPGLLVNVALKDHWHRPRPVQTRAFGGELEFRPWYRLDGGCRTNCSFVSGEASGAAWLMAPASLAPPPLRLPAMVAAGVVAVLTAALRMAFGGHYASDVAFAILLTLALVQILHRLMIPAGPGQPKHRPAAGLRDDFPSL